MSKKRISLDWISVFTALALAALVKAHILNYIPW